MLDILFGMLIDERAKHPSKALEPILDTLLGIDNELSE